MESINPAEFARAGGGLSGALDASSLSRLREQLASPDESVRCEEQAARLDYEIRGLVNERGHDALDLSVSGVLLLTCQRCLEPVRVKVVGSRRIIFAAQADALDAEYEAEDTDVVEPETSLDVATLIEDEVLLSLPLAPKHETGKCKAAQESAAPERKSPFAVLARLVPGPEVTDIDPVKGPDEGR